MLAGLRVPFICTETHELGEEIVASYLYQTFLYDWLDRNGHGRHLADGDLSLRANAPCDVIPNEAAHHRSDGPEIMPD